MLQQATTLWPSFVPAISAGVLLLFVLLARLLSGELSRLLALSAITILLLKPTYVVGGSLRETPAGIIPLIASFVLFAVGTAYALRRTGLEDDPVDQ